MTLLDYVEYALYLIIMVGGTVVVGISCYIFYRKGRRKEALAWLTIFAMLILVPTILFFSLFPSG
jgi:cytochrome bd-type quinol oxidase subunit 2